MTRAEVAAMIRGVEKRRGLVSGEILGPRKHASVCIARQECYLRLHVSGMSYPEIGLAMRKDHSTIMSGVRRFVAIEARYAEAIRLTASLGSALWNTAIAMAAARRADELKAGIVERQGWAYAAEHLERVA